MKITFQKLIEVNGYFNQVFRQYASTKFGYAIKKFIEKNIKKVIEDYQEALYNVRIEYALTDPKTGAIIYDSEANEQNGRRPFAYTPDKLKEIISAEKVLLAEWNLKEFEVEPYICTEVPELSDEVKELLIGLII